MDHVQCADLSATHLRLLPRAVSWQAGLFCNPPIWTDTYQKKAPHSVFLFPQVVTVKRAVAFEGFGVRTYLPKAFGRHFAKSELLDVWKWCLKGEVENRGCEN